MNMIKGQSSHKTREFAEQAWKKYCALNGSKGNAIDFGANLYEMILNMKEVLKIIRIAMELEPDYKHGKFDYEVGLINDVFRTLGNQMEVDLEYSQPLPPQWAAFTKEEILEHIKKQRDATND